MLREIGIRKKVRELLSKEYGYSPKFIESEVPFTDEEGNKHRADLVIYDSDDKRKPFILVEVKKRILLPAMISSLEDILLSSNAEFGLLTDGTEKYCLRVSQDGDFVSIPDIPRKDERSIDFPLKSRLQAPIDFPYLLWAISDILRGTHLPNESLAEISKLLICKLVDEKSPDDRVQFWAPENEEFNTFSERIDELLKKGINILGSDFAPLDTFRLDTENLLQCVRTLQSISITHQPASTYEAYRIYIQRVLSKSGKAGYYTTDDLSHLIVELLNASSEDYTLDPHSRYGEIIGAVARETQLSRISRISQIQGVEANLNIAFISKTLLHLGEYKNVDVIIGNILYKNQPIDKISAEIGGFGFIGTVPPWSKITNSIILQDYIISHGKKQSNYTGLLIEKCHSLMKDSGKLAIVIPEGFLFRNSDREAREFILNHFRVKAIISLPPKMLKTTGIKSNILVLEKSKSGHREEHQTFFAAMEDVESVLFDKRLQNIVTEFHSYEEGKTPQLPGAVLSNLSTRGVENWSVGQIISDRLITDTKGTLLTKVSKIFSGISLPSAEYLEDATDGVPYIRVGDMIDGTLADEGFKTVRGENVSEEKRLQAGDVLISIKGTIGKTAIVPIKHEGSIPGSQIVVLRSRPTLVSSEHLMHVLTSGNMQELMKSLQTGEFIPHLRISIVRKLKIPIPSLEIQKRIISQIEHLEKERLMHIRETRRVEKELQKLKEEIWTNDQ